ncbi:MAG: hypothetical protein JRJ42_10630 [Deltaproteobacteria bacterium]|nr:hypothetical protein [Deltaproteobacteria bacterium]
MFVEHIIERAHKAFDAAGYKDHTILKTVRALLGGNWDNDRSSLRKVLQIFSRNTKKRRVVYVAKTPYYNLFRESCILRNTGEIETYLFTLNIKNAAFQKKYFDGFVDFYGNIEALLYVISSIDPDLFHVQGWHHSYFLPMLVKILARDSPVVCEFQDVVSFFLPEDDYVHVWGLRPECVALDFFSERFIAENADGILLPYDQCAEQILKRRYRVECDILSFPSYPYPEFFASATPRKPNDLPKLLFVGGIPDKTYPDEVFKDAKLTSIIPQIISQGIHLDVFNNPLLCEEVEALYPDLMRLAAEHQGFNFVCGVTPDKLRHIANSYDYGMMLYDFKDIRVLKEHLATVIPSKLFTYMELALPVLVSEELEAVAKIVRDAKIGVVLNSSDVKQLNLVLGRTDRDKYRENVLKYREMNSVEKKGRDLLRFIYGILSKKDKVID